MADKFSSIIQKYGSVDQINSLKKLGKSNLDGKLNKSYDSSIFVGDYKNFKSTDLANTLDKNQLKNVFKLIDADGDGKISQSEISTLAKLGGEKGANKIDNKDLKALFSDASEFVATPKTAKTDDDTKVTTKKNKNGSKTVTKTKADGTKTVIKYDKYGNKKSAVKVDGETGDKTTTKFNYENGALASSSSKTTRVVDGKKVTVNSKRTSFNEFGKKEKTVVKDSTGNIISTTNYKYSKSGKLESSEKRKADGTASRTTYDPTTGKKQNKVTIGTDNKITSKVDYDSKTGKKSYKTVYNYDENGNKTQTRNYTYNFQGKVATRELYDANKNLVSKSTYVDNQDGSKTRTDRDPVTGKVIGFKEFNYDKAGRNISQTAKDTEGNITGKKNKTYYDSDILKSDERITYHADNSYTSKVKNYDKDGNLTGITTAKYDKDGNLLSKDTKKVDVKKTELKDLPKVIHAKVDKSKEAQGKGLVDYAKQFMGYNEADGSYKKFTNGRTEAWCADFVTYCVQHNAEKSGLKVKTGFGSPSVASLMDWAKKNKCFNDTSVMSDSQKAAYAKNNLKPGDIIIWRSNGASHTGIVKSVNSDGSFDTIEGNTTGDQVKSNHTNIYKNTLTGFISLSDIYV